MPPPTPAQCLEGSLSCVLAPLACSHPFWTEDVKMRAVTLALVRGRGAGGPQQASGVFPFGGASPGGVEKEKLRGIPVRVGGRKDDLPGWVSRVTGALCSCVCPVFVCVIVVALMGDVLPHS